MKRGFTLLEITVAVAVVTILTVIAVLSFSRHRSEAKKAVCASQRNSIAIAAEHWLSKNFSGKSAPKLEDLVEEEGTGYFKETPTCPCAGTYTITLDEDTKAITVACSYEEHGGEGDGDEGGGDKVGVNLFDGLCMTQKVGNWHESGVYKEANSSWHSIHNASSEDGLVELEANSEYEFTIEIPASVWDASQGVYMQTEMRVYTEDDGKFPSIMLASYDKKPASDPGIIGYCYFKDEAGNSAYENGCGYNTGSGRNNGYTAEATMETVGDIVRTTINFTTGEAGGKMGVNIFGNGKGGGWNADREKAVNTAISNATLIKVK